MHYKTYITSKIRNQYHSNAKLFLPYMNFLTRMVLLNTMIIIHVLYNIQCNLQIDSLLESHYQSSYFVANDALSANHFSNIEPASNFYSH